MTTKEYAVDLIDSHWFNCSFEDAKKHSLISLDFLKQESNSMLNSWWLQVKKVIMEIELVEYSEIKKKLKNGN